MTLFASSGLRFKVLLPVGLGLALIFITSFLSIFMMMQDHLDEMIDEKLTSTRSLFYELIELESGGLERLAEAYAGNDTFKKAFLAADRDRLFKESAEYFEGIRKQNNITHFYFHNPGGTCFLRVHNPPRHSDQINRYTIKQAMVTGSAAHGYELGPLGTLTLRVVVPWRINNRIAGFIELGKEIDTFIPTLHKLKDVDLLLTIEKKHLERKSWEQGLLAMNKTGNWDIFETNVITASTLSELPANLDTVLKNHSEKHDQTPFTLLCDECQYRVSAIPMIDAKGTEVGDLFVLRELHETYTGQRIFLYFVITSSVLVILFYFIFSLYLGRIEKDLNDKRFELEREITQHKKTENE